MSQQQAKAHSRSGSIFVAAGILLSRLMGLVRQKVFAHYFGNSDAGDVFYAALKIPNFLQNLLGDGVLSASFIPVYSRLRAQGRQEDADRVAGAIASSLGLASSVLALLGIVFAEKLIDFIAPGFHGEKRDLTIELVRIFFPSTAVLVMSAWCLGVLNSHRKFFLSYVAPVFWNLTIIAALLAFGPRHPQKILVVYIAWAVFFGSLFQFGFQLPVVLKCAPGLRWKISHRSEPLREICKNLVPVVFSRGAVQVSAYIDNVLASLLPSGAVSGLAYAQSLYLLPISLFGMSISAAELPAMSSVHGSDDEIAAHIRGRLMSGLRQISFFVIPSAVAFLALGDVIVGGIFQGGEFGRATTLFTWSILAGSTVGLLATTLARLYSSAFYSLKDTRTPLKFAVTRVILTTVLGYFCGLKLPALLGISSSWGAAGLTASAGLSGWVEFALLRRSLRSRIGATELPSSFLLKLWSSGLLAGAVGFGIKTALGHRHPMVNLPIVLLPYGVLYLGGAYFLRIEEARLFTQKVRRVLGDTSR